MLINENEFFEQETNSFQMKTFEKHRKMFVYFGKGKHFSAGVLSIYVNIKIK